MTYPKVFIVGCARSGTTWVRSILEQHPAVVSGKESHLFPVLYQPLRSGRRTRVWRRDVLAAYDERRRVADDSFGGTGPHQWVDRAVLEQLLDAAARHRDDGDAAARLVLGGILDDHFRRNGGEPGKVLVEKTPRHLFHTAQILAWWPEARIVELIRDGRDVCVSLEHKSRVEHWAPHLREEQIRLWLAAIQRGLLARQDANAEGRWHTVRYEDLTGDPATEIGQIYAFAGLQHDDASLADAVSATSIDNMRRPGNENHIRAGRVEGWREHLSVEDQRLIRSMAGDVLEHLGYRP